MALSYVWPTPEEVRTALDAQAAELGNAQSPKELRRKLEEYERDPTGFLARKRDQVEKDAAETRRLEREANAALNRGLRSYDVALRLSAGRSAARQELHRAPSRCDFARRRSDRSA